MGHGVKAGAPGGFRVFRAYESLGLRVQGLGLRVQGVGKFKFRVQGLGS